MRNALYNLFILLILASCSKKGGDYLPPDYNYPIPPVEITENVPVGAFYYNYGATEWGKKYSYTPTLGEYSSLTPAVMGQQRTLADKGGIDFFIFNWNGASAGNPLVTNFIGGRTEKVKMVINYNTAHISSATGTVTTKLNNLFNELKTLANTHFNQDYYYKVGDRPVVLITPLNLSGTAPTTINYTTLMPAVRDTLKKYGFNPYIIGEITTGWLPPVRYAAASKMMDGVTATNWSTDNYDRSVIFNSFSDINWQNWTDSTTQWGIDFTPCIFPGFSDKKFAPTSKLYDVGRTEDFYTDYCNVAKRNMGSKRIVLINSWNNYQLGTSLEPATEYGNTYLDITRAQFKVN